MSAQKPPAPTPRPALPLGMPIPLLSPCPTWHAGAAVEGSEFPVPQMEGDFSLNAANVLTADLLLNSGLRWGCVCALLCGSRCIEQPAVLCVSLQGAVAIS